MDGMNENDETMELEFSEEDIAYLIVDEAGNEIGIALYDEDGNEVEYYYAEGEEGTGLLEGEIGEEAVVFDDELFGLDVPDDGVVEIEPADGEVFEIEVSEDDIAYYIVDEEGNELGFAITEEDGTETEYYYEDVDGAVYEVVEEVVTSDDAAPAAAVAAAPTAAAEAAEAPARPRPKTFAGRAGEEVGKLTTRAGTQATKAAAAAKSTAKKLKNDLTTKQDDPDAEELGFGFTTGDVKKAAGDLTVLAKEGAQTAAELKEVYDDIFSGLDFLKPGPSTRTRR